mgnify:FL=1
MKQTIYIQILSLLMLLVTACSQEELPVNDGNSGYLSLSVEVSDVKVNIVNTKAFDLPDVEFKIDILQNGAVYNNHSYKLTTLPAKVKLEKGNYTLKIYKVDNNIGPKYNEYEKEFAIEEGKTTNLEPVEMKMQNFGIALTLPDGFSDWFKSYTFTATVGEASKTLKSGEIAYFDFPDGLRDFSYELKATNQDGEEKTSKGNYLKDNTDRPVLAANAIYFINYNMATKSFMVR